MNDSYLNGTNKLDQKAGKGSNDDASKKSSNASNEKSSQPQHPGLPEGKVKAPNVTGAASSDRTAKDGGNDITPLSNPESGTESATAPTRSITTPPGEPYNDPRVRS
jgi:hypothetical protein